MFGMSAAYIRALDGLGRKPSRNDCKFIRYCVMDVFMTQSFFNRKTINLP